MSGPVKLSEMVSIALHGMVFLTAVEARERISIKDIAQATGASEAHLSKTMQRLVKAGLVTSLRGPKGGFVLAREPGEISLLEIYEAIEGPLNENACAVEACNFKECIFDDLLYKLNLKFKEFLQDKTLKDYQDYLK